MNANINLSFKDLGVKLGAFFHRYGLMVFFLAVTIGLITAVVFLNNVIIQTDNPNGYVSNVNDTSFDTKTIEDVRELRLGNQETKKIDVGNDRLLPF